MRTVKGDLFSASINIRLPACWAFKAKEQQVKRNSRKPFIPKRPGFCIILYFLLIHKRLALRTQKKSLMKRLLFFFYSFVLAGSLPAQDSTQSPKNPALLIYRAAFPHINDLVHTKL